MNVRERIYSFFAIQAHRWQVRHYFQPAIIMLYLVAIVFADERQRVELWQQVGVNLTKLSGGLLKTSASKSADWCFRTALRHGDARQKGAIHRDQAELLSKLGRFEEAQQHIRLSAKLLLRAQDEDGLLLTRIIRSIVYCRWAISLPFGQERSNLLCNAYDSLNKVLREKDISARQNLIAQLWLSDICLELYREKREIDWLIDADLASHTALMLLVLSESGSQAHIHRVEAQIRTILEWKEALA